MRQSITKFSLGISLFALSLAGCAKNSDDPLAQADAQAGYWGGSVVTGVRTSDGKEYTPRYMINCRNVTDAANFHFYYSVYVDPTEKPIVTESEFGRRANFTSAVFGIQSYAVNFTKSNHSSHARGLSSVPVDLEVITSKSGKLIYNIRSKYASEHYERHPRFRDFRPNSLIMAIGKSETSEASIIFAHSNIPGTELGGKFECR